jgi:FixJ family two-component response regulator
MTVEHFARRSRLPVNSRIEPAQRRAVAHYDTELAKQKNRLRQSLLREEDLRHHNDELVQQQRVMSALLASREDAADCVARLTPRQRQIMEMVLAGHPSKNIAADLGLSQHRREPSRHDHEENRL